MRWHRAAITLLWTGAAVALVLVTVWITLQLMRSMSPPTTMLPVAAVLLSAWLGGWIPGMAAAVVAAIANEFLLFEPRMRWDPSTDDAIRTFVLFATAALVAFLSQQRRRADQQIARTQRHLELMTDSLPVLVAYVGTDLRYRFNNRAYADWFGVGKDQLTGRHMRDLFGPEAFQQLLPHIERALDGEVVSHETTITLPTNQTKTILGTYMPDIGQDGRVRGFAVMVADVSERRRAEAAVRASEEKFRIMADSTPVMVWIADTTQARNWFNRSWLEFSGRTMEQDQGDGWSKQVHPDDREKCLDVYSTSFDARLPFSIEYRMRRRDGQYRWLWEIGRPLFDADGQFTGYIGSCVDITDRKEHEQEREYLLNSERYARGEAERVSRLKDEFLATLSHELRTPLNAILGWAQLLRSGQPDKQELDQGLEVIERNARVQTQIISDLLDMSRIVSGKLRLEVEEVDLPMLVHGALQTVQHSADAKEIQLERHIDPNAGTIAGDAGRLQQVLWNLLSNAIKFTPRGGRVIVRLERHAQHVELTVQDTGQGIPTEFLPHVFERFRQANASTTRTFGGLGLGLSIVKSLVELHGGVVRCHSDGPGTGATFTVTLPLVSRSQPSSAQPATTRRQPIAKVALPTTRLNGVRVLAIDDEPDARELMRRLLGDYGAHVTTAPNADEAIKLLSREPFDVLLADIGMPHRDGYDLIRQVREGDMQHNSRIPAAAVTAFARTEDRTRALLSGYQGFVSKPFEPSELVAVVASLSTAYRGQSG